MPVQVDPTTHKVLVDATTGKVLSCPGCSPPAGACVHYISFQVQLTAEDVANDFSELLDFSTTSDLSGDTMEVYADSEDWHLALPSLPTLQISTALVPFAAGVYYSIVVSFVDPGIDSDTITLSFCVNSGTASSTVSTTVSKIGTFVNETFAYLFLGDFFGGDAVVNRKYRRVIASPGFNMATDAFDTLVNATVIVEGGENVLLVNSGADVGYGEKDGLTWIISCGLGFGACCLPFGTDCSIRTHDDCIYDLGGTYLGTGTTCAGVPCGTPPPDTGACCYEDELNNVQCVITTYFPCGSDPYFGYFVGPGSECPCSSACCSCNAGCSDVLGGTGSCLGAWLGWGSSCVTDTVVCQSYRHGVCCYSDPCQCIDGSAPDSCGSNGFYAGDCSTCDACGCSELDLLVAWPE